jgi:flagellar FliJ protein
VKFKFSLQKVLEHRKIKENVVQKDFQDALADLVALENKLREMGEQADEARVRAFNLQSDGGNAGPGLSQINDFLRHQKVLVTMQQIKITQQQKFVEEKRDLLRQAAVDTKVIATFKEKKFEEFRSQVESEEQKEMDEQSVLRFKHKEDDDDKGRAS